jgi:thymidylate synthase
MNLRNYIEIADPRVNYRELLLALRDTGHKTSPRGQETYEAFDVVMKLDPHNVLVTGIKRNISTPLISMESLQLITGTSWPRRTIAAAANMARFTDGEVFHGSYGQRLNPQLKGVINRLKSDTESRQAVMTIWDPLHDLFGEPQPRDVPCTTMMQFLLRQDKLIMHVTMRSNDIWWGTPHDWGQFSQLHLAMANALGVEAGDYFHHVVSLHLYGRDVESIDNLLPEPTTAPTLLSGIGNVGDSFETIQSRAYTLLSGNRLDDENETESWHGRIQSRINDKLTND